MYPVLLLRVNIPGNSLCARVKFATLMNTPSDKSCIVLAMAWETDRLKVTKYSNSSTAYCVLSEDLPLPLSECRFLSCVNIASCTPVKQCDNPAAWLHITACSLAALSQRLKMSWLKARECGQWVNSVWPHY